MKITIDENGKTFVFEGDIAILQIGTKDENGFIKSTGFANGGYLDITRVYLGLGTFIHNTFLEKTGVTDGEKEAPKE